MEIKTKRGKEKGRKNGDVGMAIGKALSEYIFLRHISYTYILQLGTEEKFEAEKKSYTIQNSK